MIQEFNTIFFAKNPETEEHHSFSSGRSSFDPSILSDYNSKGFNVYQSVNTFIGHMRKKEYLAEIRACFIDIDYPELK